MIILHNSGIKGNKKVLVIKIFFLRGRYRNVMLNHYEIKLAMGIFFVCFSALSCVYKLKFSETP